MYQTVTKRVNQYREMQTRFLSFTEPVENLQIESYTKDNGQSKMKGLDIFNFETISYLRTSEKGYIHAVGYVGKQVYQLILKRVG